MELVTQLPDRVISGVYFIKFSDTLGNLEKPRGQARYYVGYALDVRRRLEEHRRGEGAKITAAAVQSGISLDIVAVMVGGTPEDERRVKAYKNTRRWLESHLPEPAPAAAAVVEKCDEGEPAFDYTPRELYTMAHRAARKASRSTTLRKEKTRQQQLLADLADISPRATAAAENSLAGAQVAPPTYAERIARWKTERASRQMMEQVMVRGELIRRGDIFRFQADPATWFTITAITGSYDLYLSGVRADGSRVRQRVNCLKSYPMMRMMKTPMPTPKSELLTDPVHQRINGVAISNVPVWGADKRVIGYMPPSARCYVADSARMNWAALPAGTQLVALENWQGDLVQLFACTLVSGAMRLITREDGSQHTLLGDYQYVVRIPDELPLPPTLSSLQLPPADTAEPDLWELTANGDGVIGFDGHRYYGVEMAVEAWNWLA